MRLDVLAYTLQSYYYYLEHFTNIQYSLIRLLELGSTVSLSGIWRYDQLITIFNKFNTVIFYVNVDNI